MPLNLYTSNRMEVLVDALATTLEKPLASSFTQEVIVVQSRRGEVCPVALQGAVFPSSFLALIGNLVTNSNSELS